MLGFAKEPGVKHPDHTRQKEGERYEQRAWSIGRDAQLDEAWTQREPQEHHLRTQPHPLLTFRRLSCLRYILRSGRRSPGCNQIPERPKVKATAGAEIRLVRYLLAASRAVHQTSPPSPQAESPVFPFYCACFVVSTETSVTESSVRVEQQCSDCRYFRLASSSCRTLPLSSERSFPPVPAYFRTPLRSTTTYSGIPIRTRFMLPNIFQTGSAEP